MGFVAMRTGSLEAVSWPAFSPEVVPQAARASVKARASPAESSRLKIFMVQDPLFLK